MATIDTGLGSSSTPFNSQKKIIRTASDSTLHAVHAKQVSGVYNIFYNTSTDSGSTWTNKQITFDATNDQTFPIIVQDSNEKIYVFWAGVPSGGSYTKIQLRILENGNWSTVGTITTEDWKNQTRPIADIYDTTVHVAYEAEPSAGGSKEIRYAQNIGGAWSNSIHTLASIVGTSATGSIVADSNDYAHIMAYDSAGGKIYYYGWNGTTWDTNNWTTGNSVDAKPSIDIDSFDEPKIAWEGWDSVNAQLGVFFVEKVSSVWQSQVMLSNNNYPFNTPHLSIDSANNIHVVNRAQSAASPANYQVGYSVRTTSWATNVDLTAGAVDKEAPNLAKDTQSGYALVYDDASTLYYIADSALSWAPYVLPTPALTLDLEKKLEYVSHTFASDYINDNNPTWEQFLNAFAEYLDQSLYGDAINFTDNLNYNKIYSELLQSFVDQYFGSFIDTNKYSLTDDNKKLFMSISKIITGLKGNQESYDFLFKYLQNINIEDSEGGSTLVDEFNIIYEENEDWWGPVTNFYDGTYLYDGSIIYDAGSELKYTYKFTIDQNIEVIQDLLDILHPLGFFFIFVRQLDYTENIPVEDTLDISLNGTASGGSTTTLVIANWAGKFANDYFNSHVLSHLTGTNAPQTLTVTDYDGTTGTFTFATALAINATDTFSVVF
jgi:hypothetical protein